MSKLAEKLKAIRERGIPDTATNIIPLTPPVAIQPTAAPETTREDQVDHSALILSIDRIEVGEQARKQFDRIDELAASIRERGQLQPIVVREIAPHQYKLLAGERRLRACRLLQHDAIKAIVLADIEDELQWRLLQLTENLQREDYAPLELATELHSLKARFGFSDTQLAEQLQLSRTWVWKQLSLLDAPVEIREAIEAGRLAATDYLNNKSLYLAHAQGSSSAADRHHGGSDERGRETTPTSSAPIGSVTRITTVQVPLSAAMEIAGLFNTLAEVHGANQVALNKKPSKKELIALLTTRAAELHRLVKQNHKHS